jgi:hypothetical protein
MAGPMACSKAGKKADMSAGNLEYWNSADRSGQL